MSVSLDAEKVSETIGAIYDCALGPGNWTNAIGKIAEVMDSSIGMLLRANPALEVIHSVGTWGLDQQAFEAMEYEWGYKQPVNWYVKDAPLAQPFN